MRTKKNHFQAFVLLIVLFSPLGSARGENAPTEQMQLSASLQAIEHELAPHRGELGKKEGITAIESAQKKLEPILRKHSPQIKKQSSLMSSVLKIAAVFCDIDPTYYSLEFLFELKDAKDFSPTLKSLGQADQKCIEEGLNVLNDNAPAKTGDP